jgi:hypothetical protein
MEHESSRGAAKFANHYTVPEGQCLPTRQNHLQKLP